MASFLWVQNFTPAFPIQSGVQKLTLPISMHTHPAQQFSSIPSCSSPLGHLASSQALSRTNVLVGYLPDQAPESRLRMTRSSSPHSRRSDCARTFRLLEAQHENSSSAMLALCHLLDEVRAAYQTARLNRNGSSGRSLQEFSGSMHSSPSGSDIGNGILHPRRAGSCSRSTAAAAASSYIMALESWHVVKLQLGRRFRLHLLLNYVLFRYAVCPLVLFVARGLVILLSHQSPSLLQRPV